MVRQIRNAVDLDERDGFDTDVAMDERHPANSDPVVSRETDWRRPPVSAADAAAAGRIAAASWTRDDGDAGELSNQCDERFCTVGISLTAATVRFEHGGKLIWDGPVMPGSIQITAPGETVKACYSTPSRVMHLFVAPELLSRRYEEAEGALDDPPMWIGNPRIFRDVAMERLASALEDANPVADAFGRMYADSICDAIVARLLGRRDGATPTRTAARASALPKWRLRRAIDFIEANLAQPIGLADVAASAGLTRMHFAAQFRSTTGYSPYAYLLRRRIEHAQMLLRTSTFSVLEIALHCGFASHAHFTTVFKRMTGEPPNTWRLRMRDDQPAHDPCAGMRRRQAASGA